MTEPSTTVEAVRLFLATRRPDPTHAGPDAVAAASALRLAAVLDASENGSAAANASRELRQNLEALRLTELDPLPSADELRERRQASKAQAEWDALLASLGVAEVELPADDDGDDPDPPTFAH